MTVTVENAMSASILVVDDEPEVRLLAKVFLERGGFKVVDEAEDGPQALERFVDLNPPPVPAVVVLDQRMPGLTGLEVAAEMLERNEDQVIVLFSAQLDDAVRERAREIGIAACVSKLEVSRLPEIVRTVLEGG